MNDTVPLDSTDSELLMMLIQEDIYQDELNHHCTEECLQQVGIVKESNENS